MEITPFEITDTYELLGVMENIKQPSTFLSDIFFPNSQYVSTDYFYVEYRESHRSLAPYLVRDSGGVNVARGSSKIYRYTVPQFGAKRVISIDDIRKRAFGEQFVYSKMQPHERAAQMQAQDLVELLRLHANRKNKIAADILTTGKTQLKAYADDGRITADETIDYEWDGQVTPAVDWSDENATIYDDLYAVSERIQDRSGMIPTLAIVGKNVEKYLISNKQLKEWFAIPNRENLTMLSFTPWFTSPQARFIGYISALNLEIIGYYETYRDDDGTIKPFIPDDTMIICNPKLGTCYYGLITLMTEGGQFQDILAEYVPQYLHDVEARTSSLTVYSRYLLVPRLMADWCTIKTKA